MALPNPAPRHDGIAAGTAAPARRDVRAWEIFSAFLLIGVTSFGGGVLAYLRDSLVEKQGWLDDEEFIELLMIGQMVPGLKAVNMAALAGDRLRGPTGAVAAIVGMCLPGALLMYVVGVVYQVERQRPLLEAALRGVAPAAAGMLLVTAIELGRNALSQAADLAFVVVTVIAVNQLHISVGYALVGIGVTATLWYAFARSPQRSSP